MDLLDKLSKEETYYVHPFEMCVVRTVPDDIYGWTTYVRFAGKAEHEPPRGSDIISQSTFYGVQEWITKEEYYNF